MQYFIRMMTPEKTSQILDVGGCDGTWLNASLESKITLINLPQYADLRLYPDRFNYVHGDGKDLPYTAAQFDITLTRSTRSF